MVLRLDAATLTVAAGSQHTGMPSFGVSPVFVEVDGLKIYYETGGIGPIVLLLHGWGGQVESMAPVFDCLVGHFTVWSLDLPGFGRSDRPRTAWGAEHYAGFVNSFLSRVRVPVAHVVAHSFGGRIAIVLAATWPRRVDKLILVDSAGIRPRHAIAYYCRVLLAKGTRALLSSRICGDRGPGLEEKALGLLGSDDYREAGENRDTLVKLVNEDLRAFLPRISSSTLLIWGSEDEVVPLAHARLMEDSVPDSALVVLEGAGHFSYLDRQDEFCLILRTFLGAPSIC